jgi:hypothetical protein
MSIFTLVSVPLVHKITLNNQHKAIQDTSQHTAWRLILITIYCAVYRIKVTLALMLQFTLVKWLQITVAR